MAIKKLQNNFTTPDQSKRLLELGVPADSADMHYHQECVRMQYGKEEFEYFLRYGKPDTNKYSTDIPCWSIGRLREIFCICSSVNGTREYPFCNDQVAWWITEFEFKKEFIDFSKLEE